MAAPHQAALPNPAKRAALTIRNLSPAVKERLRLRAAQHARSMEAEARAILESGVFAPEETGLDLAERIRARFAKLGGLGLEDLEIPPRELGGEPPRFDD